MPTQDKENLNNDIQNDNSEIDNTDIKITDEDKNISELEKIQQQANEYYEALLRTKADMENLRKRNTEEIEKLRKFAIENFAASLLPVMDSLQAALADNSACVETLKQGVDLTLKQLQSTFDKYKITCINPIGQIFDPSFHQVISSSPSTEEINVIIDVVQKGYTLSERLLREALVIVSAGKLE